MSDPKFPEGWVTVAQAAPSLVMTPQGAGQLVQSCPSWMVRYERKRWRVLQPEFSRWYWRRLRQRSPNYDPDVEGELTPAEAMHMVPGLADAIAKSVAARLAAHAQELVGLTDPAQVTAAITRLARGAK